MDSDDFHKSVHNYSYWIPQFSTIQNISLDSFVQSGNNKGETGLKNIENCCYMNSALQCLSNTEDLTKYFLSGTYYKSINSFNKYGSKGSLSSAYEKLINSLWNTQLKYADPSKFKNAFYLKTGRFGGSSMQDSQEMLSILLDYLHEDVNRINNKPYIKIFPQQPNESDEEASDRWWKCHKQREDSIIVDIFHGQFRSMITCPQCNQKNITYDPFLFLTLPIPIETNKYKFIFIRLNQESFTKEIQYSSTCYISQIKLNISIAYKIKIECIEAFVFDKYNNQQLIPQDNTTIKSIMSDDNIEIVFYEKEIRIDHFMVYVYPVEFTKPLFSFLYSTLQISHLAFPFAYSININATLGDLCLMVYQSIKHILKPKDLINIQNIICSKTMNKNNKTNLLPFKLHFLHKSSNSLLWKTYQCSKCVDKNVPFCNIFSQYDFKSPLTKIVQINRGCPSVLLAEIPNYDNTKRIYKDFEIPLPTKVSSQIASKRSDFTIQDCIELFTSEEKLSIDNSWYCNVCKKHMEATKKCDIYKAPNYLIIHLKRFKVGLNNMVTKDLENQKNTTFVSYPFEGLNLTQYILGNQSQKEIYDLYGVVKHFGTLNNGHYTAICKNFDRWIEYNDDRLTKVNSKKEVVNEHAYLLFYRKKK